MSRLFAVSCILLVWPAWCQNPQPGAAPAKARAGYLTPDQMPDVLRIVPPAPERASSRFESDMAIFRATRSLEGSPRWSMAQADDNVSLAGMLKAYSCSLGVLLTREAAPLTTALITRANGDAGRAANVLKNYYQHPRPFQVEDAKVCLSDQSKTSLQRVPDYVSGHAAAAWEAGLVLAALAPDAATAILARARAFGESRVVCGVHNASAVSGAWLSSTAVFAVQMASPEFQADLAAARKELADLRIGTPSVEGCALEHETLSMMPY